MRFGVAFFKLGSPYRKAFRTAGDPDASLPPTEVVERRWDEVEISKTSSERRLPGVIKEIKSSVSQSVLGRCRALSRLVVTR